jgi:hypothetical protein
MTVMEKSRFYVDGVSRYAGGDVRTDVAEDVVLNS